MRPRVIIESPYRAIDGDDPIAGITVNLRYLDACIRDSLGRGEAPFASHAIYPRVLEDAVDEERNTGIEAGFLWHWVAHRMVVYTDRGVSDGMRRGIENAEKAGLPIVFRMLGPPWLL